MQAHSVSPLEAAKSAWRHRQMIRDLIRRESLGRYRGSILGVAWSFLHPLLMLAVYTFVFSVVFRARWGVANESQTTFALILYAGLLIFNLFAETVNRSPTLILQNVNFVKKVVFPLEVLPMIAFGSALVHSVASALVWLVFYGLLFGAPSPTILLLPVVLLPLALLALGLSWFFASLGVYLRDVVQVVGVAVTTLMFLTPIFYPASALPETLQEMLYLNPMALIVEQARSVMFWGRAPNWEQWSKLFLFSGLIAWMGFAWFQKTRKGFADVL